MKYEMEEVLWIIRKELRPATLLELQSPEAFVSEKTNSILQMIERDKAELKQHLLLNNSNALIGSIPLYELDIVKAWDMVHRYLKADMLVPGHHPARRMLKKNYDKIKNTLKGLLWYIHQHFKLYSNRYQKIPNEVADDYRTILLPIIEDAENKIRAVSIERKLHGHLFQPLTGFMDSTKSFNFYQLHYLQHYVAALNKLLSGPALSNELIKEHLLMQSYNDADFCQGMIETYQCLANNFSGEEEKLLYYQTELKTLRQLQIPDIASYIDSRPDADRLLTRWLEEEISFAEKKERKPTPPPEQSASENGKIQLHLSVYELALGTRLLLDAKLISEDSFPKIASYITANFNTHKKDGLSLESFRKKSYEFERSVVNKVKDKIIMLMNLAQKF